MPGPFPGIDPYVEGEGRWRGFHLGFLIYWRDVIAALLPERYDVEVDERVFLVELSEDLEPRRYRPDLSILADDRPTRSRPGPGGTATLAPVAVPWPESMMSEIVERSLRISDRSDQSLVTAIELLSPTNKQGAGFKEYLAKRSRFLLENVHLVELDLLLGGRRPPMGGDLPPGDAYALVSRADGSGVSDVYAWSLREPLPVLPIPLREPDGDIWFDLGALYALAYERGRYDRKINYDVPPRVPLRDEDRKWVDERVRTWKQAAGRA